jgi:hypothetical protein
MIQLYNYGFISLQSIIGKWLVIVSNLLLNLFYWLFLDLPLLFGFLLNFFNSFLMSSRPLMLL